MRLLQGGSSHRSGHHIQAKKRSEMATSCVAAKRNVSLISAGDGRKTQHTAATNRESVKHHIIKLYLSKGIDCEKNLSGCASFGRFLALDTFFPVEVLELLPDDVKLN